MVAWNAKTHKKYVEEIKEIHGTGLIVVERYIDDGTKIKHKCNKCKGFWSVRPNHTLRGIGCPFCANKNRGLKRRKTHKEYLKQVKKIHKYKIEVIGEYKGAFVRIKHLCLNCNYSWKASPDNVVNSSKTGCPRCATGKRHSSKAIAWLKEEAKQRRIRIRHAENWGEFVIPETRLMVDGFHKPSNTIFEFYGDAFHGNLSIFKPRQRPHPFTNETAKSLYTRTIERENYLKELGYNLVTMWEYDYDRKKCQS